MKAFRCEAGRLAGIVLFCMLLAACSQQADENPQVQEPVQSGPPAADIADAMVQALGGAQALQAVDMLVARGGGIRNHLGQIPETGGTDPQASLTDLVEVTDLAGNRAGWSYSVLVGGGFAQQRTEAITTYMGQALGWGTTGGRPNIVTSTNGLFSWSWQNSPEFLLRRNPVSIARSAIDLRSGSAREYTLGDETLWQIDTLLDGEIIGLLVDQNSSLLRGFTALDTESMRGDQEALYLYTDFRPVGGLQLPFAVEIRHGNGLFASLTYDSISLDEPEALALLEVPADVTDQAEQVVAMAGESWVPLEWVQVAPNVYHVVAFSHHSMVVAFPSFVVVVEAPYTEGQSLTLVRLIEENLGLPIRYVIPSHPHYDHTGGLRGLASTGAAVLAAAGHEEEIRLIVESAQSNPPDALARNVVGGGEVGHVEVYSGQTEISDGDMQLLLFEVDTIAHVKPKTLAFVPSGGVLFQSDLFFGAASPDATALFEAISSRNLAVEQIVGGHGGVLPFSALEAAVGGSN